MKLLTIACERDKKQLLMQAESIMLFLKPCTHYVVINEENPNLQEWEDLLSIYYTNHKLVILHYPLDTYIPRWKDGMNYVGWHRANILKFLAFKDIQDDYLILDSKNIFIKETSLDVFEGQLGCGLFWHHEKQMQEKNRETFNYYKEVFGKYPKWICGIEMPFLFQKKVLEKIENLDEFAQWYSNQPVWPLEPMYYSFLIADQLQEPVEMFRHHWVFWKIHDSFKIPTETLLHSYDIRVLGLHRLFLNRISVEVVNEINNYLHDLGFTQKLPSN
jgi:hypothetical protein